MEPIPSVQNFRKGPQFFHIKNKHTPPPLLEGQACVYFLALCKNRNGNECRETPISRGIDFFYVGETEGIRKRLQQHRRTFKAKGYDFLEAVIVPVHDKSLAKTLETLIIQNFKKTKIPLIADKDGNRHVGTPSKH